MLNQTRAINYNEKKVGTVIHAPALDDTFFSYSDD